MSKHGTLLGMKLKAVYYLAKKFITVFTHTYCNKLNGIRNSLEYIQGLASNDKL